MRTLAILPIKSFAAAKTRLAGSLGTGSRQALAQAMFLDVLKALRQVPELDAVAVVSGDPTAQSAARDERVLIIDDDLQQGQSAAALLGIRHAVASGFERVLLVPGDTPLIDPGEVSAVLGRAAADGVAAVIVPDRHETGTNALLLTPPGVLEPSFGPDSLARHVATAEQAGIAHRVELVPSLLYDVDTPDDLAAVAAQLAGRRGSAPLTRGALRQLDRSGACGSSTSNQRPPRERDAAARNVRVITT